METIKSLFEIEYEVLGAYLRSKIGSLALSSDKKALTIISDFDFLPRYKNLRRIESVIAEKYKFSRVTISPRYETELNDEYVKYLLENIAINFPSSAVHISQCKWEISGSEIEITLNDLAAEYLKVPLQTLPSLIQTETGLDVKIKIKTEDIVEDNNHAKLRDKELKEATDLQEKELPEIKVKPKPVKNEATTYKRTATKPLEIKEHEDIIFGKPVQDKPLKISELAEEVGRVTICGEIFFVEFREIKAKNIVVMNFDVSDKSSSIRVSRVFDINKAAAFMSEIKAGIAVIVQGTLAYNNYEKEMTLNPTSIVKTQIKKRQDKSEEKRVELHLHTVMSAMDSVNKMSDYVKRAKEWGHKAIALTDHGVVQSFPDAMFAAKKNDIKVIYGVEAYFINDESDVSIVKGNKDISLEDEFVVFDIETTGLKPNEEEITEIAATVIKNGETIENFQAYVNPRKHISSFITDLTGISDETVENAPFIETVLPQFLDFVKGRVLVAHNAGFDMSFINAACKRLNIEEEFTYVDTLGMARILMPNSSRHKLNTLAKELKVGAFNHHRASEDARILSLVFHRFIQMMQEQKITKLSEVNTLLSVLRREGKTSIKSHHQIILVKNQIGLKNLYILISESHVTYYNKRPIIPKTLLDKYREGLILGSACEAGELFTAVLEGKSDSEIEKIAKMNDYLEIQPIGNNAFLIENGTASNEETLQNYNKKIVSVGKKLNIPVVATGDVHFLDPEDAAFRKILMHSKGFKDADNQAPLYFKTTDEMLEEFSYLGKDVAYEVVVKNPNAIADMCDTVIPLVDGTYPPNIDGSAKELEDMSRDKVHELYGEVLPEVVEKRLEKELKSIIGNGFDIMYIIAQKLVSQSMKDGYLVGSRGSVGSSFVAFLSGITEVNALPPHYLCDHCKFVEFHENEGFGAGVDMVDKICPNCGKELNKEGFDIPFETFLGFDGDKAPDIDLNFSGEYQAKAHAQTQDLFGRDRVFRAGTIGTVADKTAFGYVRKYIEEKNVIISKAEQNRLATGCTGVKRTTGQHPGGLIVVPGDRTIYEFTPVQYPADDMTAPIQTTHFDYHSIHDNLLKLDLLGHDDPTIIKVLEDITGVDARKIKLDDKDTMSLFTSISKLGIDEDKILGETGAVAIPEFGTKFVRGMLLDTKPTTFDELVRISGLSHGTDVWLGNAQDLVQAGTANLKQIICARDDIMNFLMGMGVDPKLSFTIMESVRKGKGLKPDWEESMKAQAVPEWYIESCKKIKYMFPKAHAVAYVMMAFRIAWFKVHKPLAFYAAYFSVRAKAFDAQFMIRGDDIVIEKMKEIESKEKLTGIKPTAVEKDMLTTLEVCHEFYARGYTFEKMDIYASDATMFLVSENGLVPPFTSMPGLGETVANTIVEERSKGKFMSVEEIIMRCDKISKSTTDLLDTMGALGDIPKTAQVTFF